MSKHGTQRSHGTAIRSINDELSQALESPKCLQDTTAGSAELRGERAFST